jgi:hypothetical protein
LTFTLPVGLTLQHCVKLHGWRGCKSNFSHLGGVKRWNGDGRGREEDNREERREREPKIQVKK